MKKRSVCCTSRILRKVLQTTFWREKTQQKTVKHHPLRESCRAHNITRNGFALSACSQTTTMIVMRIVVAVVLFLSVTCTADRNHDDNAAAYCGYPTSSPQAEKYEICDPLADNRSDCEKAEYASIDQCFWHEDGHCTSDFPNVDRICPTMMDQSACEQQLVFGMRPCTWYAATPSLTLSVEEFIETSYCGFPEGVAFEPGLVCSAFADNRQECREAYYAGVTECYWQDGNCTSDAFATGEDFYCPTVTNRELCEKSAFFGFRYCKWYEATTDQPSLTPSATPSDLPSEVPSAVPSAVPTMVNYCGYPSVEDPWASPRVLCSDATNEPDCGRDAGMTEIHCYWSVKGCTSELVATGEDLVCPVATVRSACVTLKYTLGRPCVWYEPRDPSPSPSFLPSHIPSTAPTRTPSSSPTKRPTRLPTPAPTRRPSRHPTSAPTPGPTPRPTPSPTSMPTKSPTSHPTAPPTPDPTTSPSASPSISPTAGPTVELPSERPSSSPTPKPTQVQSIIPSSSPSATASSKPSNPPTHSPTGSPSRLPSNTPTSIFLEELVQVCRCDRDLECVDTPLGQGSELNICCRSNNVDKIVLERVESLSISQDGNTIETSMVEDDKVVGSGTLFWSNGPSSSFFAMRVNLRDIFFKRPFDLVVDGRVRYSLNRHMLRRMVGSITPADEPNEFNFQFNIPIEQINSIDDLDGSKAGVNGDDANDTSAKTKILKDVHIWAPIAAVALVAFSLIFLIICKTKTNRNIPG